MFDYLSCPSLPFFSLYAPLIEWLNSNHSLLFEILQTIFDQADSSGDGQVTLEEYLAAMTKTEPKVHS